MIMENKHFTIKEISKGLRKKDFSCEEITAFYLNNIKKKDKKLHAFLTVTDDSALSQAKAIDQKIRKGGELKSLEGIPAAIKDNIITKGVKTTASSKILENYVPPFDATVIAKLKKDNYLLLGKTNCDEFAMGSSTEHSAFGPTKNPWDTSRVPGGSSGGSAAAVAANGCVYALGTDTAGSVRQPAAFCGLIGLKPTYGRVSRYGLIAMASSFDQAGIFGKTVEDVAIVLSVIAGDDELDSTTVKTPVPDYSALLKKDIKGLKVGVPKEFFSQGLDPMVADSVRLSIKELEQAGAQIIEVSLPYSEYALAVYYILMPSEVSANLARYDGIRYGFSDRGAKNLMEVYLKSRGQGFGPEVRRRIILGTYALSAGYYDAYYKKAQQVRTLVKKDFEKVFTKVDCLVGPTTPTTAFKLGEKFSDPITMYLADIYTAAANIAGLPAISVPCGLVEGLPVGLQIMGKPFAEETILRLAYHYEQNNPWLLRLDELNKKLN